MSWGSENMFLSGPYAPWQEAGEAFDLEVSGTIPDDLDGVLYRVTSSQKYRPADPDRYHWFDGDGMVHAVFLREGRACYRNQYVSTEGLELERAAHHALWGSLLNGGKPLALPAGPPPDDAPPLIKNPANTNVTVFDGRLLVFSEGGLPHELDSNSLATHGQYDFHGGITGPVTAHWKVDPGNGDLLFFGASGRTITWYRADASGKLLESHPIDVGVPTLAHDFVVAPDFAVFAVTPSITRIENHLAGKPLITWDPAAVDGRTRWAVLNRRTFAVTMIDVPGATFATTHYHNAFQRHGKLIIDGQRVPRFGVPVADVDGFPGYGRPNDWFTSMYATSWRWEIDVAGGAVTDGPVTDVQGEFPRINDGRATLEHEIGYFVTTRKRTRWFSDGMAKHDYRTGRTEVFDLGPELIAPSEPAFAPRRNPTSEDDGWLLSYWWDPATDRSELVIQDALDFTGRPVARVKLHHRVSLGFHGNWVPAADIPGLTNWG